MALAASIESGCTPVLRSVPCIQAEPQAPAFSVDRRGMSSGAIAASGSSSSSSGSSSSSSSSYRLLYWGCTGDDVRALQNALLAKGYSEVRVADGIYGQWTYDAVRSFQKDHGLAVDGVAGKDTLGALYGVKY